ncbi:MAG TPA: BlaI/MecI/CopY family transcriptional regulator [Gemmatales bacterium]|nr:BlaI/MecI/CopY family transcriptional regulator [Gemmatales bacterium]
MARRRKRQALTRLELEIMQAFWDGPQQPRTVREVLDQVNQGRKPALAYTTVLTMLGILKGKGVVTAQPGPGRAHSYRATVTQDDIRSSMIGDLVDRLFGGRVQPLLQNLVAHESLNAEELKSLNQWIETRLDDYPEKRK